MESLESHEAGFPPFPHSLEVPSGLPHSHGLGDRLYVFSCSPHTNHRHRKGVVTNVSGPQRNACPGTLTQGVLLQFLSQQRGFRSRSDRCLFPSWTGKAAPLPSQSECHAVAVPAVIAWAVAVPTKMTSENLVRYATEGSASPPPRALS